MSCGAETEANALLTALTNDVSFEVPNVNLDDPLLGLPGSITDDLYKPIKRLTNDDLTTGTVSGTGTFDVLMRTLKAHLDVEFKASRISGAEYSKTYIAMTELAMGNAVQFLVSREQSFWASILSQAQAVTARVELIAARVKLVALQFEAKTAEANYGLTKMKISTESMAYCTAKYQLENLMPVQLSMLNSQKTGQDMQNNILTFNREQMLPKQLVLVTEQGEAQRAQTANTRADGADVTGVLGNQIFLLKQQVISYQRDGEIKAAKIFSDAWITMKSMDEGLLPPSGFQNTSLDGILTQLKTKNGLN